MFTGHKEGRSGVDLAEKLTGAKIAIFNPQVTCRHRLEHISEQRALLVTSTINWPIFEAYPGHAFTSFLAASHPAWRRFHP